MQGYQRRVGAWKSGGFFAIHRRNLAIASFAMIASRSSPMRASSALLKFAWIAWWQIGCTGTVNRPFFDFGTG
jgi:hypothetical protein